VLAAMQQQRLHELLIEQVTRAVPVAMRVASIFARPPPGGLAHVRADV